MDILAGKKLVKRDGSAHDAEQVLSSASVVGIYFSARWCPPCRMFTPMLADFYTALQEDEEPFEVIFVSSDRSQNDMLSYMKEAHGDWYAVEFNSAEALALKSKFEVSGIPMLVVVTKNGQLITKDGRSAVTGKTAAAPQRRHWPTVFSQWKAA